MTHLRRSLLASTAVIAFFAACGGDTPVAPPKDTVVVVVPPPPSVASITIVGPGRLTVGRTAIITATPVTSAGVTVTGKTVAFSTSNGAAVTVAADGTIKAVAPGTAIISATVDSIVSTLTVISSDASLFTLTLTGPANPMVLGGTAQLTASGKDSSNTAVAIRSITYASSNPNIVSVSPTGLVTALALGTATITAEGLTVAAVQATVVITVIPAPVASVVILPPADTILRPRFPKQLVAQARDSAGNVLSRPITYTSSNVDVAVLDIFGLVTATGEGPVTITASSSGKSASVRLFAVPDSGLYIAATGGVPGDPASASSDQPGITSASTATTLVPADGIARFDIINSTGSYRVRASTSADPARSTIALAGIALLIGSAPTTVPVTIGPPATVVSVAMKPYAANITAPATAGVGSTVTVTWTFDEATAPFSFFPDRAPTGALYYSSTSGADLSGTPIGAVVTRDPTSGISTFSASFIAPSTPGTIYLQVYADGAVARLLYPIVFRGQTMRTITVQ
ncbi:MAG: Ig-like domain-containing protein [bacterium]